MRPFLIVTLLWLLATQHSAAQGTFRVRFQEASYSVVPGADVRVTVLIDPVPEAGLFSYGLRIAWDAAMARVESASSVVIPPPLAFNGVQGPGPMIALGDGFAAAKGTVDIFAADVQAYSGNVLATVVLRNLSGEVGRSYPLALELYRTLGASESIFVTGKGEVLDGMLSLGSGLIVVIPEFSAAHLLVLGTCLAWLCGPLWRRVDRRTTNHNAVMS